MNKFLLLTLFLPLFFSCDSKDKEKEKKDEYLQYFDKGYKSFVQYEYDKEKLTKKRQYFRYQDIPGIGSELHSVIDYRYNDFDSLWYEDMTTYESGKKIDSAKTTYLYDENKRLKQVVKIDAVGDTINYISRKYENFKDSISNIYITKIAKKPYNGDSLNMMDTSYIVEKYINEDLINIIVKNGKGDTSNLLHNMYDDAGKIYFTVAVNEESDTLRIRHYEYDNDALVKVKGFDKNLYDLYVELYNENECIEKKITQRASRNAFDTTYFETDENCRLKKVYW